MSGTDADRKKREELVRELGLVKHYRRTHTPSGVHRRLPEPPEKEPDVSRTGTRRRLSNLHPPKKKAP